MIENFTCIPTNTRDVEEMMLTDIQALREVSRANATLAFNYCGSRIQSQNIGQGTIIFFNLLEKFEEQGIIANLEIKSNCFDAASLYAQFQVLPAFDKLWEDRRNEALEQTIAHNCGFKSSLSFEGNIWYENFNNFRGDVRKFEVKKSHSGHHQNMDIMRLRVGNANNSFGRREIAEQVVGIEDGDRFDTIMQGARGKDASQCRIYFTISNADQMMHCARLWFVGRRRYVQYPVNSSAEESV